MVYDDRRGYLAKHDYRENLRKLVGFLKVHGKASYKELKIHLGVSDPTLSRYLKELEKEAKIVCFLGTNDRNRKIYYLAHYVETLASGIVASVSSDPKLTDVMRQSCFTSMAVHGHKDLPFIAQFICSSP